MSSYKITDRKTGMLVGIIPLLPKEVGYVEYAGYIVERVGGYEA